MEVIRTLAIETSCDETSVAVLENGRRVLSNVIYTQIPIHQAFGGVVPEVASRMHVEKINGVIRQALEEAEVALEECDHLAVTYGPGLVGALLVGLTSAKAISYALNKPLVGVNHIEGHIYANFIAHPELKPPFICLVVSGGHTHLVEMKDYGAYRILGQTRDDAAGEAFDKVARAIGLGYPGGPKVDRLSEEGNPEAINFPRIFLESDSYDFSFSGLKSSVLNYLHRHRQKGEAVNEADVAASFQAAVIEVLVEKAFRAASEFGYKTIAMAGGVSANRHLRRAFQSRAEKDGLDFYFPPIELCTDNAAMIGCAGYYQFLAGKRDELDLNAIPSLKLANLE
ncbi:tRNA (adenosine(37)-N6)-threonylcarbamoyltransferase complex transferase subunit TsaD [Gottschalkiaceae bacterium SANA]|nr:tRNA (adenosine(37)-N6)-threonylcarbamoyltransferase complex transferase subunit TsaD [Gottschalkiaceae bacterium SANA]